MPHVELPQAEFKVVMLGETCAGKTSLVLRFAEGYYRDSSRSATVGAFFITKRLTVHGLTCKIQIWDTAGQEQFKKLAPMYYKNAAAAIVCYDCSSPKSFETLKFWLDELQRNVPAGQIVMAMCATKCDLLEQPDISAAEELAQQTGSMFLTTSAKNNDNVTMLFEQVAERVLRFQRHNFGLKIPVTLATTPIDEPAVAATTMVAATTTTSRFNGTSNGKDVHVNDLEYSSSVNSPSNQSRQDNAASNNRSASPVRHSNNGASIANSDDDDNIKDAPAVVESESLDTPKSCGSSMLMCGDILGGDESSSEVGGADQDGSCAIL